MMGEIPEKGKTILSYLYTRKVKNRRWRTKEKLAYSIRVITYVVTF
jgi:hypothetical protein